MGGEGGEEREGEGEWRRGRGGKGGGGGVEERERWVHTDAAETCCLRKKRLADLDSYTTVKEGGGTVVL